jgi:hypothetical protein
LLAQRRRDGWMLRFGEELAESGFRILPVRHCNCLRELFLLGPVRLE